MSRYAKKENMKRLFGTMPLLLTALGASAQTGYPEKPVRVVAPFPPGTGADISARIVTQKFSELWGKPVVVENVPGAAGSVGAERVAKSAPDGYTLLFSGDAAMTTNVSIYSKLAYEPLRDFVPIMLFVETPNILLVHPSSRVRSSPAFLGGLSLPHLIIDPLFGEPV
jgi:tripartite-type tricarboxylate transporter receptor subunit TctC